MKGVRRHMKKFIVWMILMFLLSFVPIIPHEIKVDETISVIEYKCITTYLSEKYQLYHKTKGD